MSADALHTKLSGLLGGTGLGSTLHVLEETGSTNDVALALAREGAPHGTVVLALAQTSGRGRMGRTWSNRHGDSLCLSLLLRPGTPMKEAGLLTFHAGLAAHCALSAMTGLPLHIKWPNDILWENRKLCGILTESAAKDGRADCVVVGFGCNLNQNEEHFPLEIRQRAISLAQLTGRTWDIAETAAAIVAEMARVLARNWEEVLPDWKLRCASLGKNVRVATGGEVLDAVLLDVDPEGALLLKTADTPLRRIHSAEIL